MTVLAWSPWIYLVIMAVVCGYALTVGAWETRLLAGLYALASLASPVSMQADLARPQWGVAAIDLAYLAAVLLVVVRSPRPWPVLIGAAQLLALATHLAFALADGHLGADAYFTVLAVWTYGVIVCLAAAAWRDAHARRRR